MSACAAPPIPCADPPLSSAPWCWLGVWSWRRFFTGYFYVTAFEQLQLGIGDDARVFDIDDQAGALLERSDLEIFVPPSVPSSYCL